MFRLRVRICEREFPLPQGGSECSPAVERSGTPGTVAAQSCRPVRVGLKKGFDHSVPNGTSSFFALFPGVTLRFTPG